METNQTNPTTRRHFTAQEKVMILKENLLGGTPVSTVCDQHKIAVSQFYQWQKQLFENAALVFERSHKGRAEPAQQQRVAELEEKLKRKDAVIAEIMAAHIDLKKTLGEI